MTTRGSEWAHNEEEGMMGRAFLLGLILAVFVTACGPKGYSVRLGPIGIGTASTEQGGVEGAISGPDGAPLVAGRVDWNTSGLIRRMWAVIQSILPSGVFALLSDAATPTGPVPDPAADDPVPYSAEDPVPDDFSDPDDGDDPGSVESDEL